VTATVVVEIGSRAELVLDPRFTRRLVQLELSELEVPPSPTTTNEPTALFFRVTQEAPSTLRIELWERGKFYGARTISVSRGTSQLLARRIALAAAELARRLRHVRQEEARRLKLEAREPSESAHPAKHTAELYRFFVEPGASAAAVGPSELWLIGTGVTAGWRLADSYFGVRASWYGGQMGRGETHSVQWTELMLAPGYTYSLSPSLRLDVGLDAGAAVVRVHGVQAVDAIDGQKETWTGRLAAHLGLQIPLTQSLALNAGPEIGSVLRRLPVTLRDGSSNDYGGLWLASKFGLVMEP